MEQATLARLFTRWQGVVQPRRGLDALLDVIENLQGAPLPASMLETEILPARLLGYKPADLDTLIAAGEVVWCGLEPIGERDGRVALYLAERLPLLWPVQWSSRRWKGQSAPDVRSGSKRLLSICETHGASFFQELHEGWVAGIRARRWRRLEPGVARDADERCAACAAGLLREDCGRREACAAGA